AKAATAAPTPEGPELLRDGDEEGEELLESAIKASVYVPLATKCVFQRRGKEFILELAEQEVVPEAPAEASPDSRAVRAAAGLQKWFREKTSPGSQPVPRRVHSRLADAEKFTELENRCHEFVRRGHSLRAAAAAQGGQTAAAKPQAPAARV
ncbi:unnamed protein product, partial [Polarella glacialis]